MGASPHGPEPCASAKFRQSPLVTVRCIRVRNVPTAQAAQCISGRPARRCLLRSAGAGYIECGARSRTCPTREVGLGILRDFERRLETIVEGFFARALPGGGVQPVELGKRMVRAMDEEKTAAASGATYVPNAFEFKLSTKDFERLSQISSTLRKELSAVARRASASEGWRMVGPPEIHIVEDSDFKAGTFGISSLFVESATLEPEAGPQTQLIQMSLDA